MFIVALITIAKTGNQPKCPYNGTLLSQKKECIWVSSNEVDEPRACYTEWSKSEREKQISYINTYIWNLEKWDWWTYLQGSNGDVENRLMDKGRGEEGEGEMNGESSMKAYTQPHVKQIANGNLLDNSGTSNWGSVTT